jgi:hypothetical protein
MIQHHTKLTISRAILPSINISMYIKELHVPVDNFHQNLGGIETTKKTTNGTI